MRFMTKSPSPIYIFESKSAFPVPTAIKTAIVLVQLAVGGLVPRAIYIRLKTMQGLFLMKRQSRFNEK